MRFWQEVQEMLRRTGVQHLTLSLELDGRIVGKFGKAGKLPKEFGIAGELMNWRVQKLTLHPNPAR